MTVPCTQLTARSTSGGGQAEVRVRWADTRDVGNKLEVVTRAQL